MMEWDVGAHHNEKDRCGSVRMRRKQTGCLLVFRQRFHFLGCRTDQLAFALLIFSAVAALNLSSEAGR